MEAKVLFIFEMIIVKDEKEKKEIYILCRRGLDNLIRVIFMIDISLLTVIWLPF